MTLKNTGFVALNHDEMMNIDGGWAHCFIAGFCFAVMILEQVFG